MIYNAMELNEKPKKSKRIFYFDALRAFAAIAVILFHVGTRLLDPYFFHFVLESPTNWLMADILKTFFRCGVDIFLMLSGALSLGRDWEVGPFLKKRLTRITAPFVFWGIVLSIIAIAVSFYYPVAIPFFSTQDVVASFNIYTFLTYLYNSFMAINYGFSPYWFFWMILGTYLMMPFLNRWLCNTSFKEIELFLGIWLITCIFDRTLLIPFPVNLYYISGPIGMVVLGYYLRHSPRKIFTKTSVAVKLILISAISAVLVSTLLSSNTELYFFDRYSIFLVTEVTGIFLLFKNYKCHFDFFKNPDGIFRKAVFSIAKYSYGFYLIHMPILTLILVFTMDFLRYKQLAFVLFVGSLFISWFVMAVLNRVPYLNSIIGAK